MLQLLRDLFTPVWITEVIAHELGLTAVRGNEPVLEGIEAVFGVLVGRSERTASLEEIHEAAAAGWASWRHSSSGPGAASAAGCPRP